MSGYKNFAIAGVGNIGSVIADEFLKAKAARTVDKVIILSRPVCLFLSTMFAVGADIK